MDWLQGASLVAATIAMGLIAGLFYAVAIAIMPGLARADDRTFVDAMQRVNVAILNPWFMLSFLGAPLLTILAGALHLGEDGGGAFPWIVAAFILDAVMIAITSAINVPLNNALAAAGPPDDIQDLAAVRRTYESRWVPWNTARAVACTAALGCLTWALVLHGRVT